MYNGYSDYKEAADDSVSAFLAIFIASAAIVLFGFLVIAAVIYGICALLTFIFKSVQSEKELENPDGESEVEVTIHGGTRRRLSAARRCR
jgi:plastocyanin domain-containing protein